MLGSYDYAVWLIGALLEVAVVVCALHKRAFRRYLLLNLYMAGEVFVSIVRFRILMTSGWSSAQYFYFYYYSDAVLTILLFLALIGLYSLVFDEIGATSQVKLGATILLIGTALFSFLVVRESANQQRFLTQFVVQISQNLYFVGTVLTYVLWAAILKLRETRARLVQLVLALGVYFSLFAADYAFRNLYPNQRWISMGLAPLIGCFLPLAWAYAFWRLPEDARLTPSRLAVIPR